jgi:DNA-binding CsgD family transcriptional regulator
VEQPFQAVNGTTGQVWGLNEAGGTLLMGHHEGAFRIEDLRATALNNRTGAWRYLQLNDTVLIAGQYDGLSLLTRRPGGPWQWRMRLPGFEESCRVLAPENDSTLWMSHPYRGVFKVVFQNGFRSLSVKRYGLAQGLPSDLFNYVFYVGGRALVAAEHGLFRYDGATDRFVSASEFDEQLGKNKRTRFLQEDSVGNIWFVTGEETGVLWVRDEGLGKKISRQVFPQLTGQIVGGFEHIYCLDAQNQFFGTEKGFLHLNTQRLKGAETTLQVVINGVRIPQAVDSVVFGGFPGQGMANVVLPYQNNRIVVSYAATVFGESRRIQYSTRLEGLEREWSAWSAQTERDFSHLPAGTYRLLVKARDDAGQESAVESFQFRILPPWYASNWALFLYFLAFAGLLTMLIRSQRKRFEREKAELTRSHLQKEEQHLRRAEATEQELVRVQNEKLEAEVQHKNEELALATMHLVQKGEMIASIQEALERILQNEQQPAMQRQELQRLLRILQFDTRIDQDWEQFALHFDQVYRDFLQRLRERFSQLSPNDYRLCAYLRMNLNTKEIAHLMNISVRGVEGSRYRLRRKLDLPNDANLVDFLMGL